MTSSSPTRAAASARACHPPARKRVRRPLALPAPARCTARSAEDVGRQSNGPSLYVLMVSLNLKRELFDTLPYIVRWCPFTLFLLKNLESVSSPPKILVLAEHVPLLPRRAGRGRGKEGLSRSEPSCRRTPSFSQSTNPCVNLCGHLLSAGPCACVLLRACRLKHGEQVKALQTAILASSAEPR